MSRMGQVLICIAVLAVLGAVFMAYARPQLVIELTEQLWACF